MRSVPQSTYGSRWIESYGARLLPSSVLKLVENAVARNLLDFVEAMRRVAPDIGAEAAACGEGAVAFMGAGSPLTTVKGVGSDLGDHEIEAAEALLFRLGAERAIFELAPWDSKETEHRLARRGYGIVGHENVVVRQPPFVRAEPRHPVSLVDAAEWPVLQRAVDDEPGSPQWLALFEACAVLPDATHLGIRDQAGTWIACAQLAPAAEVGIFGNDATLRSARGRGAQTALIEARLLRATPAAFACVMAEVAPGSTSERNYLRCGFDIAYTRTHYGLNLH